MVGITHPHCVLDVSSHEQRPASCTWVFQPLTLGFPAPRTAFQGSVGREMLSGFSEQTVFQIPTFTVQYSPLHFCPLPLPILTMEPRAKCCANKIYLNPLVPSPFFLFVCFVLFHFCCCNN